ncbi:MAG: hypothetical protein GY772_07745, partial [bacterium]|nr:hypothetical protein [bacterium]
MRWIPAQEIARGIWPKLALEVEEPPVGAAGGYYAAAAGHQLAPRDDPTTHLGADVGKEQWWERLRPRFGSLGGKRAEVVQEQAIGSAVSFRQQIDLSGHPNVRGDVDNDPALLTWRERASMALKAIAKLCAPLQVLHFELGEEALGTQVPRLLGPVLESHGIGIGATRLSPDEWVSLAESRGLRGGGHPLPPLSVESGYHPMWVVGDSILNLKKTGGRGGSTAACNSLRTHYFANMGWRTQAGAQAKELLEMCREWDPVECGLGPKPETVEPSWAVKEEPKSPPRPPHAPPPAPVLGDWIASMMAPQASGSQGAAGHVSEAQGLADDGAIDVDATQGGVDWDAEWQSPTPEGFVKRNKDFRGSAKGVHIPIIPDCYQGDGSRPGVCICFSTCNEGVDKQWNVVRWSERLERYYHDLAKEMILWEHAVAVVGGNARQWGLAPAYDHIANRCRKIMRSYGVLVVDGIQFYDRLITHRAPNETYHLTSNETTAMGMRDLVQAAFDLVTTIQFPIPWWSANAGLDWPVVERHFEADESRQVDVESSVAEQEANARAEDPLDDECAVEPDIRDRWTQQHQDEVMSEHEGEGLTPRRRQTLLDADATQCVLREAVAADALVANRPQGTVGQAEAVELASAAHSSAGVAGMAEVAPRGEAQQEEYLYSDDDLMQNPAQSLAEEERRMLARRPTPEPERVAMLQGKLQHTRELSRQREEARAAERLILGRADGSVAQGSATSAGPPATTVGDDASAAQGGAGSLRIPLPPRGSVGEAMAGDALPKTPTSVYPSTPPDSPRYVGAGAGVGCMGSTAAWPVLPGQAPVVMQAVHAVGYAVGSSGAYSAAAPEPALVSATQGSVDQPTVQVPWVPTATSPQQPVVEKASPVRPP